MQSWRSLPRYLCLAYTLLLLLVCLHPFSGWTSPGESPLAFLTEPWQKYISLVDVYLNIAGFVPFGFMLAASIREGRKPGRVVLFVCAASFLLSFSIEFIQNWLPSRVSSNLDLATNFAGGFIGALAGVRWGRAFGQDGPLQRWRNRRIQPGHIGELGLLLIGLWWLSQLEPGGLLFGAGDLRSLFDLPAPLAFSARRYFVLEVAVVASSTLGVGLFTRRCMREPSVLFLLMVLLLGLGLRSLANYFFLSPEDVLAWATPGALRGLLLGVVLFVVASRLPRWGQHSLASLTLLVSTALVNLAPENPFIAVALGTGHEGHLLNFYGLTRLVTLAWPFFALTWLSAQAVVRRW
ncbi:VanZ family protein [Uliginosibacterium paludis]|uniref:VanZ family protein n=1 Tax=Uliginosibacterium paludis TaxID=1615952 RepID=A0ABV2CSW3_9RHOO